MRQEGLVIIVTNVHKVFFCLIFKGVKALHGHNAIKEHFELLIKCDEGRRAPHGVLLMLSVVTQNNSRY